MNENMEIERRGWWSVEFKISLAGADKPVRYEDLSEETQDHICKEIWKGMVTGEICEITIKEK